MLRAALLSAALFAVLPATASAATPVANDTFTRSVSNGWGSADLNGTWSPVQGPSSALSVGSGQGTIVTPEGYANLRQVALSSPPQRDVDVTAKLSFSDIKGTGAYSYTSLLVRRQANGSYLRVGLWAFSTGKLLIHSQTSDGATVAADADTGVAFTPGTSYTLRVQVQGASPTTIRAKAWKTGTAEPAAWQQEAKTTQGPQVAGTLGVRTSAIKTASAVSVKFDDVNASLIPVATSDLSAWNLVASDEFNGTTLGTSQWSAYNSAGHGGNGVRRPSQVKVANGSLVLTAEMINGVLSSGAVAHRNPYTYGRFEFRVRTDKDPSAATSGVVLTWPHYGGWPATGENDIYETGVSPGRNPFHTFVHYGATNQQESFTHYVDGSQWHVMAMEWSATAIRIYRDNELVWTLTNTAAIPDVAHHLTVQLDAFKRTMGAPVRMYVDYVRIYQHR
jgi:hypothetical protein